ncbi:MAG: MerR family transcriptional regulator [Acidimicrobiia bacterium]|nr:MerR family transcriptional regulator [Acidimicrobiia bacterium]
MSYSVGEVSKVAGVTIRTLHHYDEIGLLRPAGKSLAGYRQYDDVDLERLQEILFYRELGFGLEEIAGLVNLPTFNRAQILRRQRTLIEQKIDRLQSMVKSIDRALQAGEEGHTMTKEEMFEVFGNFDPSEHEDEVRERWGDTEAFGESSKRAGRYSRDDWKRVRDEADSVNQRLADLCASGTDPEAAESMEAAEQHRLHIDRWFYPCTHEMHAGLGDMYVLDPRFTKFWDDYQPGLATFVREAFLANGRRAAG